MRIPQDLPQFENESTLIVTANKSEAELYVAKDHEVSKIEHDTMGYEYSGAQGKIARRGSGRMTGTESAYERGTEKMEAVFIPKFIQALKDAVEKYHIDNIYMFAPAYQQHYIEPALPQPVASKMRAFIKQNLAHQHPKVLLERIKQFMSKDSVQPLSPEVLKILRPRTPKHDEPVGNEQ